MDFRNAIELFHILSTEKLGIIYLGPVSDDITDAVIDANVAFLSKGRTLKSKRRFSFLLAESLQNLIRYGVNDCSNPNVFFLTSQLDYAFTIITINLVDNCTKTFLENKLSEAKEMDKAEMRAKFIDLLKSSKFNRKGGAGLGLFEMVRRSNQKPRYWFKQKNNNDFYFILKLIIGNIYNINKEKSCDQYLLILDKVKRQHVNMIHKGSFLSNTYIKTSVSLTRKALALQNVIDSDLKKAELFMFDFLDTLITFAKTKFTDTSFFCFVEKAPDAVSTQLSIYCNIQKNTDYPQTILLKYPDCNLQVRSDGKANWVSVLWKDTNKSF
jgi:hypothetical protein